MPCWNTSATALPSRKESKPRTRIRLEKKDYMRLTTLGHASVLFLHEWIQQSFKQGERVSSKHDMAGYCIVRTGVISSAVPAFMDYLFCAREQHAVTIPVLGGEVGPHPKRFGDDLWNAEFRFAAGIRFEVKNSLVVL